MWASRAHAAEAKIRELQLLQIHLNFANKVVEAALELRNSGYDGEWIGDVCEPLWTSLAQWERVTMASQFRGIGGTVSPYEEVIIKTFQTLCEENGAASPAEVTQRMATDKTLASLDTAIEIADLMRGLRKRGVL